MKCLWIFQSAFVGLYSDSARDSRGGSSRYNEDDAAVSFVGFHSHVASFRNRSRSVSQFTLRKKFFLGFAGQASAMVWFLGVHGKKP
jgi:hypothetical protein